MIDSCGLSLPFPTVLTLVGRSDVRTLCWNCYHSSRTVKFRTYKMPPKKISQAKIHNALAFMRGMGFPDEKVKPVLKTLVKVYDANWEFVEAENYKILVDGVLESVELDDDNQQFPSSTEPNQCITNGNSDIERKRTGSTLQPASFRQSGDIMKPTLKRASETFSNVKIKVPKTEPHSHGQPDPARNKSFPSDFVSDSIGRDEDRNFDKRSSSRKGTTLTVSDSQDLASSSLGEIKLSLACDKTLSREGFHMPDVDRLLNQVEHKYLGSYKIIEPHFSLKMLMQNICKTALDLGSNNEKNYVELTTNLEALKTFKPLDASLNGLPKVGPLHDGGRTLVNYNAKMDICEIKEVQKFKDVQKWAILKNGSLDGSKPTLDVNDISRGEETVPISLVNEWSSESCPPSFYYIPKNIVFQSAYVNFSLARTGDEDCCPKCFGDCLASPIPCPCTRETGGEYAYTVDGLIKKYFLDRCISMNREPAKHPRAYCQDYCPLERFKNERAPEPCKGHLSRKFIKECWSKCGCSKRCGNRVVQRGITRKLQVFNTNGGKGWGLRTLEELPRGSFVCEYVGEILTNTELYDRNVSRYGNKKHTYPVQLDADWGSEAGLKDEEALCLDATFYGNVARFVNHRCCDSNLVEIPVEVETPDRHYYHLAFFTARNIEALEELTWDYGIDFDDIDHPVKAFECQCGSELCRDANSPLNAKRSKTMALASELNPKAGR